MKHPQMPCRKTTATVLAVPEMGRQRRSDDEVRRRMLPQRVVCSPREFRAVGPSRQDQIRRLRFVGLVLLLISGLPDGTPLFVMEGFLSAVGTTGLFGCRAACAAEPPAAEPPAAGPPSGLAAAMAIEQALVDSIRHAEGSVVAVARVRRSETPAEDPAALGPLAIPQLFADGDSPAHPDFVPNEFGAGVAVDREGLILTTAHVLGDIDAADYYVWMKHRPFKATVVAADPWYDLAVLKIDATDLVPIVFAGEQPVRKGSIVIALGNPYAIARDGEVSASWGIISNLGRRAPKVPQPSRDADHQATLHHYGTLLQTDARLNIGYSGGALINLKGEMIGLTTSYAAGAGYDKAAGFAIPIDENFKRVVALLKQGRKPEYGFLGVEAELLAEEVRRDGQHGALVRQVLPGTPADRAGLRAGDLITEIDGERLSATDDMIRLIASRAPAAKAVLSVAREFTRGERVEPRALPAVLTKRYFPASRRQYGTAPEPTWRGMQVDYSTASPDFAFLGPLFDPARAVYVVDVAEDSAAWNAGVRSGSYVTRIGGEEVTDPQAFYRRAAMIDADAILELRTRQGATQMRTVSPK